MCVAKDSADEGGGEEAEGRASGRSRKTGIYKLRTREARTKRLQLGRTSRQANEARTNNRTSNTVCLGNKRAVARAIQLVIEQANDQVNGASHEEANFANEKSGRRGFKLESEKQSSHRASTPVDSGRVEEANERHLGVANG